MNKKLQDILNIIQQSEKLDAEQKNNLIKAVKDADKELEITAFKLERTEKVKKTTAILLEETIQELEQKRKAIEVQNHELEIEASLERVRSAVLEMKKQDDLMNVVKALLKELNQLGFTGIRNAQIDILDEEKKTYLNYLHSDYGVSGITENSYDNSPFHKKFIDDVKSAPDALFFMEIKGKELDRWREQRKKTISLDDPMLEKTSALYFYSYSIGSGAVGVSTFEPIDNSKLEIIKKFRNVFFLSYRRFHDIVLAEKQARESEIQLALERVRARTMAMHNSSELAEAAGVLFQQFVALGITPKRCFIGIIDKDKKSEDIYLTSNEGKVIPGTDSVPMMEQKYLKEVYNAWKHKKKHLSYTLQGQQRVDWTTYIMNKAKLSLPEYTPDKLDLRQVQIEPAVFNYFFFSSGHIGLHTVEDISEEEITMLKRFSAVFEQTYTRFLDLQKAEAQAREAQIEASLEKVRSSAMAMHKSNDISSTTTVIFEELKKLNIKSKRCGIGLLSKDSKTAEVYASAESSDGKFHTLMRTIDMTQHESLQHQYESWIKQENYETILKGEELRSYYKLPFFHSSANYVPTKHFEQSEYGYYIPFSKGLFYSWSENPYKKNETNIFNRFKSIIELTFRRFFDLQKAETQAREAHIEAALERVRSRTMGMHKSEELKEVIQLVYEQFVHLNIHIEHTGFIIDYKARDDMHIWLADQHMVPSEITIPCFDSPPNNSIKEAKEKGKDFFKYHLSFEEKNKFYRDLFKFIPGVSEESLEYYFNCPGLAGSGVLLENIGLYIENFSGTSYTDEENNTLMRFGKVFQQTYTRFLDLKKAEEQAREAQIEASLERVRSKTMAMHNSQEVGETVITLFDELVKLGLDELDRCGIGIMHDQYIMEAWTASKTDGTKAKLAIGHVDMRQHALLHGTYEGWRNKKESFQYILEGDDKINYFSIINNQPNYKAKHDISTLPPTVVLTTFYFKEGGLYAFSDRVLSPETAKIFVKFAGVFGQTYRRYLDLLNAEAQAREAVKQASLDRIRGEIASMRTAEDLNRITPIIWRELTTLEVPFIRCGVFIVNEEEAKIHVYLSTPDGKALGVLNLSFGVNKLTGDIVDHWRKKQVYKEHWNKEEFINWTKSMIELGQVQNAETYQGSLTPPESLNLNFIPFTQGMLYVGNVTPLDEEKLELVKTLSEAFSIAYARYEDFKNLEDAKNKIELTLSELKSAQAQLVHSEKMASLGEITAGIAHEIKNPLNFVNNFSDISRELIDEVKEELQKNNNEEVLAILEDLKLNLEKINQHGKRADSIVKGMLLHSRGSSGEKILTDINDLMEQYVTLAYHGMRAQNKEFNITIEKNYDKTLEKINVVPQDISRVFLNIINNACYAAYEKKKKSSDNNFSPTLRISTKNLNEKVEIRIGDNGNGIPANILDKIFQPFFTTKPTGEGTGLGLSLSYDIVTKVHGGDLKVETKEGEGSEFIINLNI